MHGSASNRPLLTFRWTVYGALIGLALVGPYLASQGKQAPNLLHGLWLAGGYGILLTLHTMTSLRVTRRLTFQRLGLTAGETAMAVLAIGLLGPTDPAARVFALLAALMISLEHGWRLGVASAAVSGLFGLWQAGMSPLSLTFAFGGLALAGVAPVLSRAEELLRETDEDQSGEQLEKAYRIARRETTKRHEHEQQLYQERRRFEGLVEIALGLGQIRDEETLLRRVVEVAADQLDARGALVLTVVDGRLRARAESGMSGLMVEALEEKADLKFLAGLCQTGEPLLYSPGEVKAALPQSELLKPFGAMLSSGASRPPAERRIDQMIAVPLTTAQDRQPFGLLLVINQNLERAFSAAEARYLQVLSTNTAIALKNIVFTAELERSHWELIQALAQAIEAKDSYTSNHVGRVRDISVEIARAIGLDRELIKVIAISATLHDVGKISTPDSVLLKPGPLTDDEYETMKQHAENGAQILRGIRSLPEGVEGMVRHHHERWDGKGYPQGIAGADIPLGAQIISIADCYDAMTYDRPYRKGFEPREALKRMEMGCGTQFNPKLLCAFFALQGYVPQTEPTAVATYQQIVGRLKIGRLMEGGRSHHPEASPTGADVRGREQGPKPLALERN